jgi:tetratricopeptide (TPR) repeat protein
MKCQKSSDLTLALLIVVFGFNSAIGFGSSIPETNSDQTIQVEKLQKENISNETRLGLLENGALEIRRDELNYQIEKNLLKETYSSNLQTLNLLLTIILGLFTILGFFGFRDITTLKRNYDEELDKLRKITAEFEGRMKVLQEKQDVIDKANEQRDRKIKVLQIKEAGKSLAKAKKFAEALPQIEKALEIEPNDVNLLRDKAECLAKLGKFRESYKVLEGLLVDHPDDEFVAVSLWEFSLFFKKFDEAKKLSNDYSAIAKGAYGPEIINYFKALELCQQDQFDTLKSHILTRLHELPLEGIKCKGWNFDEIVKFMGSPQTKSQQAILIYVGVLRGDKAVLDPKAQIESM